MTEVGVEASSHGRSCFARPTYKPANAGARSKGTSHDAAMEAAMRKAEPVDEYAETEVLIDAEDWSDHDSDALALYAEYESELASDRRPHPSSRARR